MNIYTGKRSGKKLEFDMFLEALQPKTAHIEIDKSLVGTKVHGEGNFEALVEGCIIMLHHHAKKGLINRVRLLGYIWRQMREIDKKSTPSCVSEKKKEGESNG